MQAVKGYFEKQNKRFQKEIESLQYRYPDVRGDDVELSLNEKLKRVKSNVS